MSKESIIFYKDVDLFIFKFLVKPEAPRDCKTLIDYKKQVVNLTCKKHRRCYFGQDYTYQFFLQANDQSQKLFIVREV